MKNDRTPVDQDIRDLIEQDLGTTYAVEASAGTGKTTLLTARILHAITTGHAKLAEIVAITFTERAANELKVRLRGELEKLLAEAQGVVADRLSDALAALDAAHASTIHSFAAELLLERPVEAKVDPGFAISESLQSSLLFDEVWSAWLARQLHDEHGPLRSAFVAGLSTDDLKECARLLLANRDLRPGGDELDLAAPLAELVDAFVPKARALYRHMQEHCPSLGCSCASRILSAVNAADRMREAGPDENMARLPGLDLRIKKPRNACKGPARDFCIAGLNELQDRVDPLRDSAAHVVACRLAGVLREMVARYEAAKRERAVLDFDDLLLKARDLLRSDKAVRRYFQERFKMILVDECQDTDPLQTEIVFFLAENGAKASGWRDVEIVPGKLLFVGDPKQSIYRFRRADIETYEEAKQVVARSGKLVHVRQNFRSSASCVDWVNAVFDELIQRPDDGAYQPEYVPLEAWRTDAAPAATVLKPPGGTVFDKIDEARVAEGATVAHEVKAMIERGDAVLDKETGRMRPVAYGDVAVLFRARTAFGIYERAFSSAGIPFRAVSGKEFFARQEVTELRVVLAAIERPYDPAAVVAALRTSLLGVSDDELAAAAVARFDYLSRAAEEGDAYILGVFRLLAAWHRDRNLRSTSDLVQRVLSDTKALELFYLKPGGAQRAANLAKVIDAARAYEQTPGATFGGFVRWLQEMTTVAEEAESPLAEEDEDLVKLITIHKAKGLEFPIVVLADMSAGRKSRIRFVPNRIGDRFEVLIGAKSRGIMTAGFRDAKGREQRVEKAEAQRLFYVAATRARDRLILPHFPASDKPGGYLKYLTDLAEEAGAAAKKVEAEVAADPDVMKPHGRRAFRVDLNRKPPKECDTLCERREKWRRTHEQLIQRAAEEKQLKTASRLGEDEREDFGRPAGEGELGRSIGKAVHAVLEQADLATGAGLSELAEQEATRNGIPSHAPTVEKLARAALGMELVKRAAEAGTVYREVPFAVNVDGTILEGLIDLAFDDGTGLTIVDYKTDDVPEQHLAEHAKSYRLQVGAYALAAREVFGKAPKAAALLFLRAGREIPVEIGGPLLDSVRKQL